MIEYFLYSLLLLGSSLLATNGCVLLSSVKVVYNEQWGSANPPCGAFQLQKQMTTHF